MYCSTVAWGIRPRPGTSIPLAAAHVRNSAKSYSRVAFDAGDAFAFDAGDAFDAAFVFVFGPDDAFAGLFDGRGLVGEAPRDRFVAGGPLWRAAPMNLASEVRSAAAFFLLRSIS